MTRLRLLPALLAALLGACHDPDGATGDEDAFVPQTSVEQPATLGGLVRFESGRAASGIPVSLLDRNDALVATTLTDEAGAYHFDVTQRLYRLRAETRSDGGAALSQSRQVDLRAPGGDEPPDLVLPDADRARLVLSGDTARGDSLRIAGLPPQVTQAWAAHYAPRDTRAFPGPYFTAEDAFRPGDYFWFATADEDGAAVSQFAPALTITAAVDPAARPAYQDIEPGNGQIDVGMVSFDEDRGLWQREAAGVLVDAAGAPLDESALDLIRSGGYTGDVFLRFHATHFSWWSTALFFRVDSPDYNDANAVPQQAHLRPMVPFNAPTAYSDLWLGRIVSGESDPQLADWGDDGMISCNGQTWVQATYKSSGGTTPRAYLQVFQIAGAVSDAEGGLDPGLPYGGSVHDVAFTLDDWTGKNIEFQDWAAVGSGFYTANVRLDAPGGSDTTAGPGSHTQGYTRLLLTKDPIRDDTAIRPADLEGSLSFEFGETEDYLDSCRYRLRVAVGGETGDTVTVDGRSFECAADEVCELGMSSADTLTFSATREGAPIDVDWSLPLSLGRLEVPGICPTGPSCTVTRQDGGTIHPGDKPSLGVSFPESPQVQLSYIRGQGRVSDRAGLIDCDARDPDAPPAAGACRARYRDGDIVTLQAEPAGHWEFAFWFPQACFEGESSPVCSFEVASDDRIYQQAYFEPQPILSALPGSGGTVISEPAGIDCDGNDYDVFNGCSAYFPSGSQVTLIAVADEDRVVESWTGPCTGVQGARCTLTVEADTQVGVNFGGGAVLQAAVDGNGRVASTPAGIDCTADAGSHCAASFALGAPITLAATPDAGHAFVGWGEPCAGGTDANCQFTHDRMRTVTARFGELFDLDVSVSGAGGQVSGTGSIIGCEEAEAGTEVCRERYVDGSTVELVAEPLDGFEFIEWSGDCAFAGSDDRCRFVIDSDRSVIASFRRVSESYELTLFVQGGEGGAGDYQELLLCDNARSPCTQVYAAGSIVSLYAVPYEEGQIHRWSGACAGTPDEADCTVTMDSPLSATVTFMAPPAGEERELTVTLEGDGDGTVTDDQLRLSCSSGPCTARYAQGATVTLSASPATTDDVFVAWTAPAACAGSTGRCTITMDTDMSASAEFTRP